jgi:hypothetical protein
MLRVWRIQRKTHLRIDLSAYGNNAIIISPNDVAAMQCRGVEGRY